MLLVWTGIKKRQVRTEQVKVNFTFQTNLIFVSLEYEIVGISIVFFLLIPFLIFFKFLFTYTTNITIHLHTQRRNTTHLLYITYNTCKI